MKKTLKEIADELREVASMVENADKDESPIIQVILADLELQELSKDLNIIRESYLV